MALANLKKCLSKTNHPIKILVLIGCLCFSVYQVIECIEKLLRPPISTYYGFHLNETMTYPSVTICRRPAFKTNLFPKYGLGRTQNLLSQNLFRSFLYDQYTIRDFLNETTYSFEEVFGLYAYNGYGASLADVDWVQFDTINYGKCYLFTPRVPSSTFSISGGWWFYLNHDVTTRSVDSYGESQNGFHVYVHDAYEIMASEYEQDSNFLEYIYLESEEDLRLHLRFQEFYRVNTNENPCIDPRVQPLYSRSKCLETCIQYQIANHTNCTLPWLWLLPDDWLPQCNSSDQLTLFTSYFLAHNRRTLLTNCSCPKSCHVTIYTPTIISRKPVDEDQSPNSFLAMYYVNNLVTEMREVEGYGVSAFVSDIGGSLGFLLGLSVIGFITVLEKTICSIIRSYFNKKNGEKEDEHNGSETHSVTSSSNVSDTTKVVDDESLRKYRYHKTSSYEEDMRSCDTDELRAYERTRINETNPARF